MAVTFSATSYLTTGGTFSKPGNVTSSCWVNFNGFNNVSGQLTNRIFGCDDNYEVRITQDWSTGIWKFANEFWSSTNQIPCISSTTVALNTWYHLACSLSSSGTPGVGSVAKVYVNGILENTVTYTSADTATGTTLWIGNRVGSLTGQCMNGTLDDLRLYSRVLSAGEIATIYNCFGSDHIWYGLLNQWRLNEGAVGATATAVVNDTTNTFNATPTGSPVYAGSRLKWRVRK
jgi:hypothetical protein